MKRKKAIKKLQNGEIQIHNDLLPSTKEIKKLLKEAFPEDNQPLKEEHFEDPYFYQSENKGIWYRSTNKRNNFKVVKLSEISKSNNKKKQIEKQFSELAKDVAELKEKNTVTIQIPSSEIGMIRSFLNLENPLQEPVKTFEPDFENVKAEDVSGWYKDEKNPKWIMYVDYENKTYYGIDANGNWHIAKECGAMRSKRTGESLCSPQEVEQALIAEAKKRGFIDGVNFYSMYEDNIWKLYGHIKFVYNEKECLLEMWSDCAETKHDNYKDTSRGKSDIFCKGKWAEIIEETPIKEDESIDWDKPQLLISKISDEIFQTTGKHDEDCFEAVMIFNRNRENTSVFSEGLYKQGMKIFKGTLTINQE